MLKRRVSAVATTAFSKRPVSMKYRGLFRLTSRQNIDADDPMNGYAAGGFMLNYLADYGRWTLQEGLAEWKKRFSTKGKRAEQ
jgi:hypothetical protein